MNETFILLISDEPNILRTLRRNLISRGYNVKIALDQEDTSRLIREDNFSLFVLNLDFETINIEGLDIVNEIRSHSQAPLIVLSSIGYEDIKIRALDNGADDYLVMPFGMGEFLARVRSALRRWEAQKAITVDGKKVIVSGELLIDTDARQVKIGNKLVHLTPTEFDLLYYLAKNQGKVITHRELLRKVWGPEYGDEREYLRVFISQVRKKIERDPLRPKFLLTEPRIGYRFNNNN